jgi:hypothetical protein
MDIGMEMNMNILLKRMLMSDIRIAPKSEKEVLVQHNLF